MYGQFSLTMASMMEVLDRATKTGISWGSDSRPCDIGSSQRRAGSQGSLSLKSTSSHSNVRASLVQGFRGVLALRPAGGDHRVRGASKRSETLIVDKLAVQPIRFCR